jgi:glycosyltransferase involved in cell wall biosynthesis
MKKTKQRILFFTPFASRTGSEMMLLYIIQRIDRSRFDIGIVCFAPGELLKEMPADVKIFIAPGKYNLLQKIQFHVGYHPTNEFLRKVARDFKPDLWYVNTTMLPQAISIAKEFPVKTVAHIHELPLSYAHLSKNDIETIMQAPDLVIGCSQVTCDAIQNAGGKRTALLYSFIDSEKVKVDQARSNELRTQLGIPANDFVWVLSGTTSERKGFDLLPDIAEALNDPQVHLLWVGEKLDDGLVYYTDQRLSRSSTKTQVHLVGKQKNDYYNYLNIGNGFLLTSRQDPYPLVMLEAALLGKPIASFPSGGVVEFIEDGMGLTTDDISVKQLVNAMRNIMDGQVAIIPQKSIERARQFSIDNGYAEWLKIVDQL